jgi:hypothetical protein
MVEIPIRSPAVWFEHLPSGTFEELAKMGAQVSNHFMCFQPKIGWVQT